MPLKSLLFSLLLSATRAQVPGAVYTESGYDNAFGEDAICWSAPAFHNHTAVEQVLGEEHEEHHEEDHDLEIDNFAGINWHSELVPSFIAGPTTMLGSCPTGTTVHVDILPEKTYGSYRLRTNRLYVYHVVGQVDLGAIREQYDLADTSFFYSSDGLHDIGLRIEFCPVNGNLCSPFVLERLDSDVLDGHIHKEGHDHLNHESSHGEDHSNEDGEEEHHDDEDHDDEDDHDHDHRIRRRTRQVHYAKVRATQVTAFNLTFDETDEDGDGDTDHVDDQGEEEGHDDEHHDDNVDGDGEEGEHAHEDEGEHADGFEDEDEHHEADGDEDEHDHENSHGEDSHGEDSHDSHDHGDDHAGHSLDVDESRVKHLSSKLFLVPVNITNETIFEFHLDVDVEVSVPGNYLPLASLQFFMSNETIHGHDVGIDSEAAFKFDVANLLHQRAVFYYDKANILTVSKAIEILSYVIIGAAGLVQLFCLCATFYYRDHSVMKLSQGSFLMILQGAGIVATACSFLYNPKSDAYCILQSPMTLIPLQFMFAIVFGRLRRIIRIMEPLMNWNTPQSSRNVKSGLKAWKNSFMMRNSSGSFSSSKDGSSRNSRGSRGSKASSHSSTGDESPETQATRNERTVPYWKPKMFCRRKNVRQTYTVGRLWLVIAVITLPIVVVEIIGLALFRPELTLDMNDDESIGRLECGTHEEQIYHLASTAVLLVTIFFCLFEAQRSRRLPGLFNEAESVSFALLSSLFVGGLGFAVIIVSGEPTSDPTAPYIMEVIIVSYIATILVVRLSIPKLRLIWKGEQVVIAKMLSDHRKTLESSTKVDSSAVLNGVSGLSGSLRSSSRESLEKMERGDSLASVDKTEKGDSLTSVLKPISETEPTSETDKSVHFDASVNKRLSESSIGSPAAEPQHANGSRTPLVIRLGQQPPDRLLYRILKHSNVMSKVNERILSGLQVDHDGWEEVRASLDELHGLMGTVEYR